MRYHLHHCPPLLPVDGGPADVRLVVAQSQLGLPGTSEHHSYVVSICSAMIGHSVTRTSLEMFVYEMDTSTPTDWPLDTDTDY